MELLLQLRDNIMTITEDMNNTPGIMSQMPPLPMQMDMNLANAVLPPSRMHSMSIMSPVHQTHNLKVTDVPGAGGGAHGLFHTTRSFICDCLIIEYPVHNGGRLLSTQHIYTFFLCAFTRPSKTRSFTSKRARVLTSVERLQSRANTRGNRRPWLTKAGWATRGGDDERRETFFLSGRAACRDADSFSFVFYHKKKTFLFSSLRSET